MITKGILGDLKNSIVELDEGKAVRAARDLKLEFQRFNEIAFVTALGGHVNAETAPILGGYCGGPEGVGVTNVAYHQRSKKYFERQRATFPEISLLFL